MTLTLGISAFYHDSAATLLRDNTVVCAFQEERFSRVKQDKRFPRNAIRACLEFADITINEIDHICYYEDPDKKYSRIISTYRRNFPKGLTLFAKEFPEYRKSRRITKSLSRLLEEEFGIAVNKIEISDHHRSHAASAYYPSPFTSAAVLPPVSG
jgi:carbamoyltransferase